MGRNPPKNVNEVGGAAPAGDSRSSAHKTVQNYAIERMEPNHIYAQKYQDLVRRLQGVFIPPAEEPRAELHVSLHHDTIPERWSDAGARGACGYAVISEIVSEGGGAEVVVRERARTLYSCVVYFFADRVKIYANEGTRDCYRNAVAAWLRYDVNGVVQA